MDLNSSNKAEFVIEHTSKLDSYNLETYMRHVEVLEPSSQKSVEKVLQAIAGE